MMRWLKNQRNRFDFGLRQRIGWRIPFKVDSPQSNFAGKVIPLSERAQKIARRLISNYHFEEYQKQSSSGNFQENLFYLHMLETSCNQAQLRLPDHLTVFDIGTSHWFYAPAFSAFLTWYQESVEGRQVIVYGFESDPFRVYADFHSRYDHAIKNCRGLEGFQFFPHGFEPQDKLADLITFFFPFVFETDHLNWGLPLDHFNPADLILKAWKNLQKDGRMLIVNQGEEEHQRQKKILDELGIPISAAFKMDDVLFQYNLSRYVLVSRAHE